MKVFKFGGASIKDADSVRNLMEIVKKNLSSELVIVVSAIGKMTNAFEKMTDEFFYHDGDINALIQPIKFYHNEIAEDLFDNLNHEVFKDLEIIYERIKSKSLQIRRGEASYDFLYDQVVSEAEILSGTIIAHFLNDSKIDTILLDSREIIRTSKDYREAIVDWEKTDELIHKNITHLGKSVYLLQGFIGSCEEGHSTTLGREGSDFTAAIIGNLMNAKEVVIWKDVSGLLNADPKFFSNTRKLNNISYHEAIELAYYGATIIHPKTIKPLQNKGIPLYVKSFKAASNQGSLINENTTEDSKIPSYICRSNQILYSIFTRDYSFANEQLLSELFSVFAKHRIKINLMENSAIGFAACFDFDEKKLKALTQDLSGKYKVLYNTGVELMTIRHYDQATLNKLILNKEILVEQKSRHTARMVIQNREVSNNH